MFRILNYHYNRDFLKDAEWAKNHDRIIALLDSLKKSGKITEFSVKELRESFPNKTDEEQFLEKLREFSVRHHVGLARVFGSRKHGFWYLPPQFLLVLEDGELKEVFPHEVDGVTIDILGFLEPLARREPWTQYFVPSSRKTKHEDLVEKILSNAGILEPGLELTGRNVHLSGDFSDRGYVDLVFRDPTGRNLLVEVKTKPEEIDKALGQILRHKDIYVTQNFLPEDKVRVAVACPNISVSSKRICQSVGIVCFQV